MNKKRLLLSQRMEVSALGAVVTDRRKKLDDLILGGVPFSAPEMLKAKERLKQSIAEWKRAEQEYLELRTRLGIKE